MGSNPQIKQMLWFVFAASRGGKNRIRIISKLRRTPLNANRLSIELGLNYKAIQHHLRVLEMNNLITRIGGKYGAAFFISPLLESNASTYETLVADTEVNKVAPRLYVR